MRKVSYSTYVNFRSNDNSYWEHKKKRFKMSIPVGYEKVLIEGSHENEVQFVYPDSSIIYFSNDLISGSFSNWKNLESISTKTSDYLYQDTIRNEGFSDKGYWRELKLKDVIIGYLNAPLDKKEAYNGALESIR